MMWRGSYVLMVGITLLLNRTQLLGQSFYVDGKARVHSTGINENSDNWLDLDYSEAVSYLQENGFDKINKETSLGYKVVSGKRIWENDALPFLIRSLLFKDEVIEGCSDYLEFVAPCFTCLAEPVKSIAYNSWIDAKKMDTDIRMTFLQEYKKSLYQDGLSTELYGASDNESFSYSTSKQGESQLIRKCEMELEGGVVYRFKASRTVKLIQQEYLVSQYNLIEVNQYDLNKMVSVFLEDCSNHGIKVPNSEVIVSMKTLEGNTIGLSFGMHDDNRIEMAVDPQKWSEASPPKRWYILYHELGHDVLNLEHGQAGKMMFNFADKGYSWEEFWKDKEYMLNVVSQ